MGKQQMKRQIICKQCATEYPILEYPDEWVKRTYGKAKNDCWCDLCGTGIVKGRECIAESTGLNGMRYREWEMDYIEINCDNEGVNN